MITVATFNNAGEAHFLKHYLEDAGIAAFLQDEIANGLLGARHAQPVRLQVTEADAAVAKPLVDEYLAKQILEHEPYSEYTRSAWKSVAAILLSLYALGLAYDGGLGVYSLAVFWLFANLGFAIMRANANPDRVWRVFNFIAGFPGTLASCAFIKEGSREIFGIPLKAKKQLPTQ